MLCSIILTDFELFLLAAIRFTQSLQKYEKSDEELATMSARFKTIFMPPLFSQAQLSSPSNQGSSANQSSQPLSDSYEANSSGNFSGHMNATSSSGHFQ